MSSPTIQLQFAYSNQDHPTKCSTNYPCHHPVNYKGNRVVVILISYYFNTFKMTVVILQRTCSGGLAWSSPIESTSDLLV